MKKSNIITKEFLERKYAKESGHKLAKILGISSSQLYKKLKKFNITTRNYSEASKLGKGYKHKINCICCICKATRGETLGKNNSNYKHGKCIINYCINCNNIIDKQALRCQICSGKIRRGINNINYIDGRCKKDIYCIECNKFITYNAKRCSSCSMKNKHRDNVFNYNRKPNKPENKLIEILNNILPKEYKYVGDGKIKIDTFNPDFINCNGQKKIIELYGDYWHNKSDELERNKRRIKTYKKYGYKTLVIWEHELKDLDKLKGKIKEFN